jgi:tetratricopeptide (TPR) repeat protein
MTSATLLTPLVGREAELVLLAQALERASSGRGQAVAVVGETGVGKSRLVHACGQTRSLHGWRVLATAATSDKQALPYGPVVTLLQCYSQIEEGDQPHTIRTKLTDQIKRLDANLEDTIPALLCLLDALPAESPFLRLELLEQRHWTLDALKQLLLRESQVQPLLLVVEDLHWVDAATQAFLNSLVESLSTARILLLVSHHTTYEHSWAGQPSYTHLQLNALPPGYAGELLLALLGDVPDLDPLKRLLIERAGGHPLFLEALVHMLAETRQLIGTPGAYRPAQEFPNLPSSLTLQAVLTARINSLPSEEKWLLQTASVIGTEVPLPLLKTVTRMPAEELSRGLAYLRTAVFLDETRPAAVGICTFTHALIRETAYCSLPPELRKALHAQTVTALEEGSPRPSAAQVERLAYHALQGEIWDKAFTYYCQAGALAERHAAYREAMLCWQRALAAWRHLPPSRAMQEEGFELLCNVRQAVIHVEAFEQGIDYLREAETLAEDLGDSQRLGRVSALMLHHFRWVGEHERAFEHGQRALTLLRAGEHDLTRGSVNFHLGQLNYMLGRYQTALAFFRHNVPLFTGALHDAPSGLTLGAVGARTWMAMCMEELGMFAEGITYGAEAIRIAEAAGHFSSVLFAQYSLGRLALRQGDISRAIPLLEHALGHCRVAAIPLWTFQIAVHLAIAYALMQRFVEARALIEELSPMRAQSVNSVLGTKLGEAYLLTGQIEDALDLANQILVTLPNQQDRGSRAWLYRLVGDIHRQRHRPDMQQAEAYYQQALALAEEFEMRPLQAHCHLGRAKLFNQTAQVEQARVERSTAIKIYRALEMTFWLPHARATSIDRRDR